MSRQTGATKTVGASPTATRMASEERRQQIVTVAMRLFSHRGFRGTTTKEIAQAAGVSEAIIFRHFATKGELYSAILDLKACYAGTMSDICVDVAGAMERGDDRAVFAEFALGMLEHHEHDIEFVRLLFYSALEGHELFQMFWERNVRETATFMRGYIAQRQQQGAMRELDPLVVARAFIGMIVNHSLVNTLFDPQRSLLDITNEQAARDFTDIILKGIASGKSPARRGGANGKQAAPARRGRKNK